MQVIDQASCVLAFFLRAAAVVAVAVLGAGLTACASADLAPAPRSDSFSVRSLPGVDGQLLQALYRSERVAPLRYRVIVIPGSGCAGMGPWAERYFAGLLHAQVLVLHKPGVAPDSRTAPGDCSANFVQTDALGAWREHARAAVRADAAQRAGDPVMVALPQLLIGISEGAELLPALAPEVVSLAGVVLIGSSGLNPLEAGTLQARRLGAAAWAQWQALGVAQAGDRPDSQVQQGRSLRYWRDLWSWSLLPALLAGPWPLLQVWGADDARVPASAYARFMARAQGRVAPYCPRRLAGADHGLQRPAEPDGQGGHDGVQQVWGWLENWARAAQPGMCAALAP
ncbi:alpha/beta hydrolase [Simplicispira psychrophila]|uniref:alpha/beta hydrolase n=1 Tax=Simplicispira psychrophila TaxID=80882 RepID=UPI000A6A68E6|nr:alpha/beta hydrolase [Simplicispira psychrophila]